MVGYKNFSLCYDEIIGKRFNEVIREKFKEVSKKFKINFNEILDLGCGTGLFLKNFYGKNIKLVGIDQSFEMLFEGKKIKDFYGICFSFPPIPIKEKFSLIVCFYDTLNHILNSEKLRKTFKEVKNLLKENGFFIFDTNSLLAFKRIYSNPEPYIFEMEEGRIEIKSNYFEELLLSKVEITGKWKDIHIKDEVYEKYWSEEEIQNCLKEAGFNFIKKEKWSLGKSFDKKPYKIFWIAKV